ncbi:hypothetical protein [Natrialba asiatica]|uniref:Hydrolase n=1 Tax=Natrialba asiatica (strain ATCC 700177 / DSM 12278 / JCM 9576 / FERM P-10747 / NBRC 102637 / 172P1) TaxID=29540 RepID=M0B4Y9_NATA1|nr:hypothetical protein [Natrialba asiatica]ELZ05885.1 hydrolase [Natrialba asiatica DSM 12278]
MVEREVEGLTALVDGASESAFVYGMSSGAVLALEAANRGLNIMKLALYEPPFIVESSRPPIPEEHLTRLDESISSDRRGNAVEFFTTDAVGVSPEAVAQMRTVISGCRATAVDPAPI